jgi:hypothetical protein
MHSPLASRVTVAKSLQPFINFPRWPVQPAAAACTLTCCWYEAAAGGGSRARVPADVPTERTAMALLRVHHHPHDHRTTVLPRLSSRRASVMRSASPSLHWLLASTVRPSVLVVATGRGRMKPCGFCCSRTRKQQAATPSGSGRHRCTRCQPHGAARLATDDAGAGPDGSRFAKHLQFCTAFTSSAGHSAAALRTRIAWLWEQQRARMRSSLASCPCCSYSGSTVVQ